MNLLLLPSAFSGPAAATPEASVELSLQTQPASYPAPEADLYQLFYQSKATGALPALEQLYAILACSRTYNAAHHITGVLLSSEGHFVQLLEGPAEEVRTLYATIEHDSRHRQVQLVRAQAVTRRYFPQWHMGFGHVAAVELAQVVQAVQQRRSKQAPHGIDPLLRTLWQAIHQRPTK